jgi:hypothetical protein
MSPLDQLVAALRQAITDGAVTREGVERLRQLALHWIDHGTDADVRERLRAALDNSRPDAKSFASDSGHCASRAW